MTEALKASHICVWDVYEGLKAWNFNQMILNMHKAPDSIRPLWNFKPWTSYNPTVENKVYESGR